MSKQYSYILFDNPDNVCSLPKGGKHVFSDSVKGNGFAPKRPTTFVFEKFPSIEEWMSIFTMTLMVSRSKGSSGLVIQVGHAKLHHTDSFSRKAGVVAAKANMTTQHFTINDLYLSPQQERFARIRMTSDLYEVWVQIDTNGKPMNVNARVKRKDELDVNLLGD